MDQSLTLKPGQTVEARLPNSHEWQKGRVAWATAGHYGVELDGTSFTISVPPYCVRVVS